MTSNYQQAQQSFDLQQAAQRFLSGSVDALNACYECCDRHALPGQIALFWQGKDGRKEQYTFRELQQRASQFANFLKSQGYELIDLTIDGQYLYRKGNHDIYIGDEIHKDNL